MGLLDALKDKQFRDDLADNGLNFLKSASNAVAGNVTGPVDAISWALRKAGLPIPDAPLGGSNWAKNAGLLSEVQHNPSAIAGETFGLLAPVGMTAGAPKIAKGLLQVADNAAAPRMMNPETGAIVWHGSPHKFDKFDSSKIGTGEGAQAYGHGVYFAESPDVAKSYQNANTFRAFDIAPEAEKRGLQLSAGARGEMIRQAQANSDPMIAAKRLQYANSSTREIPQEKLADLIKGYQEAQSGALYQVDLPDEHIAKMLDWDKPLSSQSKEVQSAFGSVVGRDLSVDTGWAKLSGEEALRAAVEIAGYKGGGEKLLSQAGIPGIRYLDGGSRGTGAGTSNFVVFPGNEGLLQILERNGQAFK